MIIPTIQTDSVPDLQAKLDAYAAITLPQKPTHMQIDINDGLFSNHISVQPADLRSINWHNLTHEYHLLVDHPDEYLGDISEARATTVIPQIEHMHDRQNIIDVAKQLKLRVGFALDIYTPVEEITVAERDQLDLILLMGYKAGHSGPSLNPYVLEKISALRGLGFSKTIQIDGGVTAENLIDLKRAGADAFAVNSSLWHDGTVEENLSVLVKAHSQK
jgi:ribulose-phosphate 3-epimerase